VRIASYDGVFDYRLGRIFSSVEQRPRGLEPAVFFDWGRPQLFHSDWTRIERRHPVKRGERIISVMVDLGDTKPPVSSNQPFPNSPLLEVASPVEVRVDGQPAEVLLKIGMPGEVNRYRVDFQLPKDVRPGAQLVEVTCRGLTGPPTQIASQ
jgi:uncharacterized protein (TIGR03437 family)